MESGVATRPIEDLRAYYEKLNAFVFRTTLLMKPIFARAKADPKRVVYAEGEEETVLRAVQNVVDEGIAKPILIGRPAVIEQRIERLSLRLRAGIDFELCNIESDPRFKDYWTLYHELMQRRGVSPDSAKAIVRSRATVIAGLMVRRREADALICGLVGRYQKKLAYLDGILPMDEGVRHFSAMTAVFNDKGVWFFVDTHVAVDPDAERLAEAAQQAIIRLKMFGIMPKVAALSHSNFGSHDNPSAAKMRRVVEILRERAAEGRDRRRDARRCGAQRGRAHAALPELAAQGHGEPLHLPEHGRGEHRVQHHARDDRRRRARPDPDGLGEAGARADAGGDRAARVQHDRARVCRGADPRAGGADAARVAELPHSPSARVFPSPACGRGLGEGSLGSTSAAA